MADPQGLTAQDEAEHAEELVRLTDTDPDEYVRAANVHRRHLTRKEQLAQVLDVPTLKRGDVKAQMGGGPIGPPLRTNAQIAEEADTSVRSVKRIKFVRDHGTPDHIARLEAGEAPSALAGSDA